MEAAIIAQALVNRADEGKIFRRVERPPVVAVISISFDGKNVELVRVLVEVRRHMSALVGLPRFPPGTRQSLPCHDFRIQTSRICPLERVAGVVGMPLKESTDGVVGN